MPYLELITNVSDELITKEFEKSLGDAVAKTLETSRENIFLYIDAGKRITKGVNNEPCACVKLSYIPEDNINEFLGAIKTKLKNIGIEPAFIYFEESKPYQRKTFHEIVKEEAQKLCLKKKFDSNK